MYAISFKAADIRPIVMKYNMDNASKNNEEISRKKRELEAIEESASSDNQVSLEEVQPTQKRSKWDKYIDVIQVRKRIGSCD